MLKRFVITNHLGESITLDMLHPETSGFMVTNVDGLGPVKANINFTELATNDGSIENSARLESRNIVFSLVFLDVPSIEENRLKSYKYFPVKRPITILVETDNRICEITGRVESNEPVIFSKVTGCQVSVMCGNPYFYSAGEKGIQSTVFNGVVSRFSFPFSNNSLTERLIKFGDLERRTEANIFYDGDSEIGITIKIHAMGLVEGLEIYSINTRKRIQLNDEKIKKLTGEKISAGDDIIITTVRGQKGVILIRGGTTYNILNALSRPIEWFQLSKGDNLFAYIAEFGQSNITFRIENRILYEGV